METVREADIIVVQEGVWFVWMVSWRHEDVRNWQVFFLPLPRCGEISMTAYNVRSCNILHFVDGVSRHKFLLITNLTHFFMYLFISPLYMFLASQCSSSGDRIVLMHHLVWLVCVSECLVCRSGGNCSSLLTGIPSRLMIPDDVLIQLDLLMMSTVTLETCRDVK
jgi:hypothetical protein